MSNPGVYPDGEDQPDDIMWSLLLDKEMTAGAASVNGEPCTLSATSERVPLPLARTKTGRYIAVTANLRGDFKVSGLLACRSGGRIILSNIDREEFHTFHTRDALHLSVTYLDPPEDETS